MGAVSWTAPTSRTTGIASATVNSGALTLGSEIDNETNADRWMTLDLSFQHGTGPTAGRVWKVWIILDVTSADYEDGDGSTEPLKAPVALFPARSVTAAQQVAIHNIPIPPFAFKLLLMNDTNQNSSSSAVTLLCETYNETVA